MHRVHQACGRCSEKVCLVGIFSRVRLVGKITGEATSLQTSRGRTALGREVTGF